MKPVPKPNKKDRIAGKDEQKQALSSYRRAQAAIAIDRDDDKCVFCWFLLGKETSREDVHHVYGRGKQVGDWREQYKSLLCTCRKHHPQPIKGFPGQSPDLAWIEDILKQANETPINKRFSHT